MATTLCCLGLFACEDRIGFDDPTETGAGAGGAGGSGGATTTLLSEDCTQVVGDPAAAPLVIGVMAPLTGSLAFVGEAAVDAYSLAVSEIAAVGGLPLQGVPPRPIAFLVCDEVVDPLRAAHHLVEDVGVPAIVGPMSNEALMRVATEVSVPENVVLVSPTADHPAISQLADQGLVWRTTCSAALQARAFPSVVDELEAKVRGSLNLSRSEPIRLAVVSSDDAWGQAVSAAAVDGLVFNGQSARENGDAFATVTFSANEDPSPTVAALVEFAPHVIVAVGGGTTASILDEVEASWPAASPRPEYLLSGSVLEPVADALPAAAARLRGTRCARVEGSSANAAFSIRYEAQLGSPAVPLQENVYDAAYVTAYGLVGAGSVSVLDGPSVALGLTKLSSGTAIEVGPTSVLQAASALAVAGTVDLEGASGHLDFDATAGEPIDPIEVLCVGSSGEVVTAGQIYDHDSAQLTGTFTCP